MHGGAVAAEGDGVEMTSLKQTRAQDEAYARLALDLTGYAVGVPAEQMATIERGNSRAAYGRQVAMYLCHVAFEMSLGRVAAAFARDRSTAAHACHAIEDRREDAAYDAWVDTLEAALREAPPPLPGAEFGAVS